ncbi:hypothetical protein VTO73DRAFT_12256 [Trametes versicolor]
MSHNTQRFKDDKAHRRVGRTDARSFALRSAEPPKFDEAVHSSFEHQCNSVVQSWTDENTAQDLKLKMYRGILGS